MTLVAKPSSPAWVSLSDSQETRKTPGGVVIHRIVTDLFRHVYSCYDLVLEGRENDQDSFLATVRPTSADYGGRPSAPEWKFVSPLAYPAPRVVQDGDDFQVRPGIPTGADTRRLLDELIRNAESQRLDSNLAPTAAGPIAAEPNTGETIVEEPARQFSGDHAEMRIWHPSFRVSGVVTSNSGLSAYAVDGPFPWFYVPGRGRYILSLLPRPGFVKAGEVRGATMNIVLDHATIEVWSSITVAPGNSPYFLYTLHDADWEPTSGSQRARILVGTVGPEEVEAMAHK
jgi:hypothetical protein